MQITSLQGFTPGGQSGSIKEEESQDRSQVESPSVGSRRDGPWCSLDPVMVAQIRPQQDQGKCQEDWEEKQGKTRDAPLRPVGRPVGGHHEGGCPSRRPGSECGCV